MSIPSVCMCIHSIYLNSTSGDVCVYELIFYMHHLNCTSVCSHDLHMCVHYRQYMRDCVFASLPPSVLLHAYLILRMNIHRALSYRVCVCVCVALSVSPQSIGGVAAGCAREGKGTMNDIDRQRAAERLPRSRDTELIADSRCVSNCGGVGRPGYVSVSSVSACQEANPLQSPQSLLLIRGLISVNHRAFRSPLRPAARITG